MRIFMRLSNGDYWGWVCCLILLIFSIYSTSVYASNSVEARYVQVELPGDGRVLSLAEVEVFHGKKLISQKGRARQVNTAMGGSASRAIDGNTSGVYSYESVTHTQVGNFVWWELDLGAPKEITSISLYNRTDCCGDRINPARVMLLDEAKSVVWLDVIESNKPRYDFRVEKSSTNTPLNISRNLLRNAAFRQRTNPLIPDYWDLHHAAATKFRKLHSQYYVDDNVQSPVNGAAVLRIQNSEEGFRHTMLIPRKLFTKLSEGYYTFSVSIKTDRVGAELCVAPGWAIGKEISKKLSTEWKRYSFTFNVSGSEINTLQPILRFPHKGTYFIVAPQLERGVKPNIFQPAYEDAYTEDLIKPRYFPPGQRGAIGGTSNSITVSGQPFYTIGIVAQGELPGWYLSEIKEHGINTLFYYRMPNADGVFSESDISDIEEVLLDAAEHDLKVVVGMALAGAKPANWRACISGFSRLIGRLKDYAAVIGWYPVDEPSAATWKDYELIEIYRNLKELDPERFLFLNWAYDGVPMGVGAQPRGTLDATDIYSVSYYPFAGQKRTLEGFTETILRALKTARINKKSFHSWLQLYGGMDAWREPTGDELNYMAYLNFVYGGMISYWGTKSNSEATWKRISKINHEGRILAEELFLNQDAKEILAPVEDGKFIYSAWKKGKSVFLVVVFRDALSGEFTFDTSVLTQDIPLSKVHVRSIFEERDVPLVNGYIKELFTPVGTRVYELMIAE